MAVNDLATHQQALADTEDQLHQASQQMQARVPDAFQDRLYKAVAPDVDRQAAQAKSAESPTAHFAMQELGDGMRDQYVTPEKQRQIRQLARSKGVNPDVADMVVNQALGAKSVNDLRDTLRGSPLDPQKAATLKAMGFLVDGKDGKPSVTDDAQHLLPPGPQRAVVARPDQLRFTPTPKDGSVPPGKILYENAKNGAQRVSDAARRMIPEPAPPRTEGPRVEGSPATAGSLPGADGAAPSSQPGASDNRPLKAFHVQANSRGLQEAGEGLSMTAPQARAAGGHDTAADVKGAPHTEPDVVPALDPTPAEKARNAVMSRIEDRARKVLESRLAGHSPEDMAKEFGVKPDNVKDYS